MSDSLIIVIAVFAVLLVGLLVFRSMAKGQRGALPPSAPADEVGGEGAEAVGSPATAGEMPAPRAEEAPPARAEEAPPVKAEAGPADDLTRIKGLGPRAADKLGAIGIVSYAQIAAWSEADIAKVAADLDKPVYAERIARDRWVEQAGLLARGETAEFEQRFGRIG